MFIGSTKHIEYLNPYYIGFMTLHISGSVTIGCSMVPNTPKLLGTFLVTTQAATPLSFVLCALRAKPQERKDQIPKKYECLSHTHAFDYIRYTVLWSTLAKAFTLSLLLQNWPQPLCADNDSRRSDLKVFVNSWLSVGKG